MTLDRQQQIESERRDLQRDTVLPGALLLFALGIAVLSDTKGVFFPILSSAALAAAMMAAGVVVILLYGLDHRLATIALAICYLTALWLGVSLSGQPWLLTLIMIPVGICAIGLDPSAGAILMACITALFIWGPAVLGNTPVQVKLVVGLLGWSVLGLLWLVWGPLLHMVAWSWEHYESSREMLDTARDRQQQLHEAMDDLASAHTQLTRLHEMTLSLRQLAEEARREKQDFVANVSHELRTPLNMIIGFCELMGDHPEAYGSVSPMLLGDLDVVLRNSRHLSSLIDDILDLSQIDADAMALTMEPTDLAEVIDEAVTAVLPLFESRDLTLEVEVQPNLPLVTCDRLRIREVLLNLLSNAGRITEQGGVTIRAYIDLADLVVAVQDTGPGIPEDKLRRLFEPFYQIDRGLNRRHAGTGLGLSISRGFVERHGGTMWAESVLGEGSTFSFRLPLVAPMPASGDIGRWFRSGEAVETRSRPVRYRADKLNPRWVVAETGSTLTGLLKRHMPGVEVLNTQNMAAAVEVAHGQPVQAVLVNAASIPEAWRDLDTGRLPQGTPVVLCSVPVPEEAVRNMRGSGYLVKPVSQPRLLDAIDGLDKRVQSILVVDDDPDALHLMGRMLQGEGRDWQVLRAYDGQQALDLLAERTVDVILLDLTMPNMNGFQFLEHRSRSPELAAIPVIFVSAHDPLGQPIISGGLAALSASGFSAGQLLKSVDALVQILSVVPGPAPPAPPVIGPA